MPEEKKYTAKEFKKYLMACDSLGDAAYYCDDEHIDEALNPDPCKTCDPEDGCDDCEHFNENYENN